MRVRDLAAPGPSIREKPTVGAVVDAVWARPRRSERLTALLDAGERGRLSRLRRPEDRVRFVAAHALLRMAVGRRWGLAPDAVVLHTTCPRCGADHGRPVPAPPDGAGHLDVSLSYAGDRVIAAVSDLGPVGVDVEATASTRFSGFTTLLAQQEQSQLLGRGAGDVCLARARTWVRKEAVVKATGHGRTVDLGRLAVTPPYEPPRVVAWPGGPVPPSALRLSDLDVGSAHAACLALVANRPGAVRARRADHWLRDES